jgi:purine-binding chemotaxis protein CheW
MKYNEPYRNDDNNTFQLCSFWIASRLYGVNILDTKEISSNNEITPVYHAPEVVRGYMNIRGQIHLVIDLRQLFGFEPSILDDSTRVILFKSNIDEPFGIIVDRLDDVVSVNKRQIEYLNNKQSMNKTDGFAVNSMYLKEITDAVCKLEKNLLVIINPGYILKSLVK